MTKAKKKPVLLLDCHRGIYFGYLVGKTPVGARWTVVAEKMRHCFSYDVAEAGHKGVYGLATVGPASGSRVGPEVSAEIGDIVKIIECTPEAVERWTKIIW